MDSRDGVAKSEMESFNENVAAAINREMGEEEESTGWELPKAQGLYDPQNEHEACGVGFIVAIDGRRSHKVRLAVAKSLIGRRSTNPSLCN